MDSPRLNQTQSVFSLRETTRILTRHKTKSVAFFCATLALVGAYLFWGPRKFESEAKLLVRIGHESVALDPTATMGQTVQLQVARKNEINSVLEILKGRGMAEKVVSDVTPEVILAVHQSNPALSTWRSFSGGLGTLASFFKSDDGASEGVSARENAIKRIDKMLSIYATRDSNVINVSCRAGSPKLAREIAASLVDSYRNEHARFNRTAGSVDFFETQADVVHKELQATTQELNDIKNKVGIVSVQARLQLLETKKMQIEAEQLRVARELAGSEAKLRSLKDSIQALDERILAGEEEGWPNEAADQMRSQLYDLEMRERALSARYQDDHPFVTQIREQFDDARKILEEEKGARSRSKFEVNPNWQQLQLGLLETTAQLAAHTKASQAISRQYAEIVDETRLLNEHALKIDELERQIAVQKESYRKYRENFEQARIDSALEAERIHNVNVVQEATFSPKPVAPNKPLLAGFGFLLALFGAVGVALVAESTDDRLSSPGEVEAELSVPVLISIPKSSTQCVRV